MFKNNRYIIVSHLYIGHFPFYDKLYACFLHIIFSNYITMYLHIYRLCSPYGHFLKWVYPVKNHPFIDGIRIFHLKQQKQYFGVSEFLEPPRSAEWCLSQQPSSKIVPSPLLAHPTDPGPMFSEECGLLNMMFCYSILCGVILGYSNHYILY